MFNKRFNKRFNNRVTKKAWEPWLHWWSQLLWFIPYLVVQHFPVVKVCLEHKSDTPWQGWSRSQGWARSDSQSRRPTPARTWSGPPRPRSTSSWPHLLVCLWEFFCNQDTITNTQGLKKYKLLNLEWEREREERHLKDLNNKLMAKVKENYNTMFKLKINMRNKIPFPNHSYFLELSQTVSYE